MSQLSTREFLRSEIDRLPAVLATLGDGVSIGDARRGLFEALAVRVRPRIPRSLVKWTAEERYISAESGSSKAGRWLHATTPHLVEPMECVDLSHPCRRVVITGSKQTGKSEVGVNLWGWIAAENPSPVGVYLSSIEEAAKYEKLKVQTTIDATPALSAAVASRKSRDEDASTGAFKRFTGGFMLIAGANSSKALQMISLRVVIGDEVTEFPLEVGGRGDPIEQIRGRLTAWVDSGVKELWISTPGVRPACRVTEMYEASDMRRLYLPCPHCGTYQRLSFDRLRPDPDHGAIIVCVNGCPIEPYQRKPMLARCVWLPTYPGDDAPDEGVSPSDIPRYRARLTPALEPGFQMSQLYSPFVGWPATLAEIQDAGTDTKRLIAVTQQVKGEPWEERTEAPDEDLLLKSVVDYELRRVHVDTPVLTAFADVQGAGFIQWRVYGWGPDWRVRVVDFGRVYGDPATEAPWSELARIAGRRYPNAAGREFPIEWFGVDSGYATNQVYKFCRAHPNVRACDGRGDPRAPAIAARPVLKDVDFNGRKIEGGVELWPTGTFSLKLEVMAMLRATIAGPDASGAWPPNALIPHRTCDREFFQQITAEVLGQHTAAGRVVRGWAMRKGVAHNEELDIAVGARAGAWHLGVGDLDADGWRRVMAERALPPERPDLFTRLSVAAETPEPAPAPATDTAVSAPQAKRPLRGRVISRGLRHTDD